MKKKLVFILGAILIVLIALVLVFVFIINSGRTLEEITTGRFGDELFCQIDKYTTCSIYFKSTSKEGNTRNGVCYFVISYYKDSIASPTGIIIDHTDKQEIPCTFTDRDLTINGVDYYRYQVVKSDGDKYVEFSKPFMGFSSWKIND